MREVVIIEALRSPIGKRDGSLRNIRPDDLVAILLDKLVKKAGIDSSLVDDVILGCVTQVEEQSANVARTAVLQAGFPNTVPGTTIERQCGSSQQAVHFAAQAILSGDMDVVIAGGVESMTRAPMFSNRKQTDWSEKLTSKYEIINQGLSAEKIVEKWGFSRETLDQFSLESHQKATKAKQEGKFIDEIVPIEVTDDEGNVFLFSEDEGPRSNSDLKKIGSLKPAFKEDGTIHAGNSSQISDGAAVLLLMSKEKADQLGLKYNFKIISRVVVGSDPTLMLTGPIEATRKVLEKANLTIDDIDIFEVNEAFAPVPLCWLQELNADPTKLNPNGGAIAIGHPLGASGARLMTTMLHELNRRKGKFALQAICEGGGMANATIIERID